MYHCIFAGFILDMHGAFHEVEKQFMVNLRRAQFFIPVIDHSPSFCWKQN